MRPKVILTKKDLIVTVGCVTFLLANLGAIGAGGRRRAKEAVCLSNLGAWGTAFQMYAEDNAGRVCDHWITGLYPYYKDFNLLLCPAAMTGYLRGGKFEAWFLPHVYFGDGTSRDIWGSYGANGHVSGTGQNETSADTDWLTVGLKNANRAPVLLDSAGGGVPLPIDEPPEYDGHIYMGDPMNINEIRNFCINRHNGGVNCLFLDFSARKVGLKELWLLKWHRKWPEHRGEPQPLPEWPEWMKNFKDYERPQN